MPGDDLTQQLAEIMHDTYEDAAALHGWSTQEVSRVRFADLPRANRMAMLDAVSALLDSGLVVPTSDVLNLAHALHARASGGFSGVAYRDAAAELRALTQQEPR